MLRCPEAASASHVRDGTRRLNDTIGAGWRVTVQKEETVTPRGLLMPFMSEESFGIVDVISATG